MFEDFEAVAQFYCIDAFVFSFDGSPLQMLFANVQKILDGEGMYVEALARIENREAMAERKRKRAEQQAKEAELKASRGQQKPSGKKGAKGRSKVELPSQADFNNEFKNMLAGRKNMKQNQGVGSRKK